MKKCFLTIFILSVVIFPLFSSAQEEELLPEEAPASTTEKKNPFKFIEESFDSYGLLGEGSCSKIFFDDFEGYSTGQISGQGGWTGDVDFEVETSIAYEGSKAVYCPAVLSDKTISRTGDLISAGVVSFYVRKDNANGGTPAFDVYESGSLRTGFYANNLDAVLRVDGADLDFGNLTINTWHNVQLEWDKDTQKVRANLDEAGWTDWYDPHSNFSSGADTIKILHAFVSGQSVNAYIDYIDCEPYSETTTMEQIELIENASTGAMFWLDKSISFGDFLIIILLFTIFLILLVQFIFKLELKQKVDIRN